MKPFEISISGVGITGGPDARPSWRLGLTEDGTTTYYTSATWAEVNARVTNILAERGHSPSPQHWTEWVSFEEAQ